MACQPKTAGVQSAALTAGKAAGALIRLCLQAEKFHDFQCPRMCLAKGKPLNGPIRGDIVFVSFMILSFTNKFTSLTLPAP